MAALNEDPNFLPEDYDDNPDGEEDEGGHKKRKQVKRACFACRKAHARCDEERPCRRCIRTGCEATCVDVPRKKRVLAKRPEDMPKKSPAAKPQRGRPRRRLDESGEGCESGGENDSKNFYFDVAEDEVLEGGSISGKTTPAHAHHHSLSTSTGSTASLPSTKKFEFSSSSSLSSSSSSPSTSDVKVSWKDSLLDSMAFAHSDDDSKESVSSSGSSGRQRDEEHEFSFDLGKSSDDERCLEEIPQEMVRELTELRSYNSTLQDMIKDVQQFNSYQRKKRRQWELNKINSGNGSSTTAATANGTAAATTTAALATAAPSDALPQWLVSDFSSLSNKMVDLSSDVHSSSSSSSSTSSSHSQRSEEGEMDYIGAWQAMTAAAQQTSHAPLHLPAQLAQLAGQPLQFSAMHLSSGQASQQQQQGSASQTGPAPFTTSLPFTEV